MITDPQGDADGCIFQVVDPWISRSGHCINDECGCADRATEKPGKARLDTGAMRKQAFRYGMSVR